MGIVLYVIASGFVLAGLLNAIHRLAQNQSDMILNNDTNFIEDDGQQAEYEDERSYYLRFRSPQESLWSIIMCFLAGPYLVLLQSYKYWQKQQIPSSAFSICVLISLMWSFCTGVFVVEIGLLIGLVAL